MIPPVHSLAARIAGEATRSAISASSAAAARAVRVAVLDRDLGEGLQQLRARETVERGRLKARRIDEAATSTRPCASRSIASPGCGSSPMLVGAPERLVGRVEVAESEPELPQLVLRAPAWTGVKPVSSSTAGAASSSASRNAPSIRRISRAVEPADAGEPDEVLALAPRIAASAHSIPRR